MRGTAALLKSLSGSGRWEEVIPLARAALRGDPLRSGLHGHLIRALCRTGDDSGAREAYRRYERVCYRELGVPADARIKSLLDVG